MSGEIIPGVYKESAFLGEKARNVEYTKKITGVAQNIFADELLSNPISDTERDSLNEKSVDLINSLAGQGEFNVKSVGELKNIKDDDSKTDRQKEIAEERLDVLAKSVYVTMRYGEDGEMRDTLCSGSVAEIEELLPEPMKGLGKRVRSNIIDDPQIITELDNLDKKRIRFEKAGEAGKKQLSAALHEGVGRLGGLDVPSEKEDQLGMVMAFIGAEADEMSAETELGGVSQQQEMLRAAMAHQRRPGARGEDGSSPIEELNYDMKKDRFIELESLNKPIRWYDERPPAWYENMTKPEKDLMEIRMKLLNACANKEYLRNKDVEKLRGNVPEITNHEFKQLMETMPGFKEGLGFIVRDLCETHVEDGRILLRLKTIGNKMGPPALDENGAVKKDKYGNIYYRSIDPNDQELYKSKDQLDSKTKEKVENFEEYRKDIAAYIRNKVGDRLGDRGEVEATSTAWNFLYIGDSIESWDYFRELKPTKVVSDKLRTMDHMMIKALGKWGVWKGYMGPKEPVAAEGQEEPFVSGAFSTWILDRVKNEEGFKNRLITGDLKDILPRTLVVSMIEATSMGKDNMSTILMRENGEEELLRCFTNIENKVDNDKNIMQPHNDMVQGGEWLSNLIKGKIQYAPGKNDKQFVSDFIENTSLVRQEPNIPLVGGGYGTLASVDKPEFFKWSVMIALGFNPYEKNPLPNSQSLGVLNDSYDIAMRGLVDSLTSRSLMTIDQKKSLYKMFFAANEFESKIQRMKNREEAVRRNERERKNR